MMNEENAGEEEQLSDLELVERKRAARKDTVKKAWEKQRVIDLTKIDELEEKFEDGNVKVLNVEFSAGLPTCVAVRTPSPPEMKRFRDRLKKSKKGDDEIDPVVPTEELGAVCRIYPEDENVFAALLKARPGTLVLMGGAASKLAGAKAEEQGKG